MLAATPSRGTTFPSSTTAPRVACCNSSLCSCYRFLHSIDLGDKKRAYRRNGIQEYIVWQVFEQKLDWFSLQDGEGALITHHFG